MCWTDRWLYARHDLTTKTHKRLQRTALIRRYPRTIGIRWNPLLDDYSCRSVCSLQRLRCGTTVGLGNFGSTGLRWFECTYLNLNIASCLQLFPNFGTLWGPGNAVAQGRRWEGSTSYALENAQTVLVLMPPMVSAPSLQHSANRYPNASNRTKLYLSILQSWVRTFIKWGAVVVPCVGNPIWRHIRPICVHEAAAHCLTQRTDKQIAFSSLKPEIDLPYPVLRE